MIYLTQHFLDDYREWLYSLVKAIWIYGTNEKMRLAKPRKVISKEVVSEVLREDSYRIIEKVTTTVVQEKEKGGSMFSIDLVGLPTNMCDLADAIGMSRQHLGQHKEEWAKMNAEGFQISFSDSYFDISKQQLAKIFEVVDAEASQSRNKSLYLILFLLVKINRFSEYRRTYDSIAEESGTSREFTMKTIKKFVDAGVLEIAHVGSNLSRLANSYAMTEKFKELVDERRSD